MVSSGDWGGVVVMKEHTGRFWGVVIFFLGVYLFMYGDFMELCYIIIRPKCTSIFYALPV